MLSMLLSRLGRRTRLVAGIVLFVLALLLFAGAILGTVTSLNLRANGVKTTATIVSVQMHYSRKSANTYTDVIEFTARDGKQYRESIGGSRYDSAGNTVAVVYDPSDPSTVESASSLTSVWWIAPVVLLVFALLLAWLGRRLWRMRPRAGHEQQEVAGNLF